MTKAKKKITKSTFAIIIMAIAMVAMLAFGGTFAYFTATATTKSANVKTGTIKLTVGTVATSTSQNLVYDEVVLGAVTYDATGTDANSYIFVTLTSTVTKAAGAKETPTWADLFGSALTVKDGWTELTEATVENGKVYYRETTTTGGSYPFLDALKITASPNWVEGGDQPKEMGATVTVSVSAKAIQKTGFDSAQAAYTELTK